MLYEAARVTSGTVVELGVGLGSTPLLHALVTYGEKPRSLVSVDDDEDWLRVMKSRFSNELHEYLHVLDWNEHLKLLAETKPSLVFVDQGKISDIPNAKKLRSDSIRLFKESEVLVVHDASNVIGLEDDNFWDFVYENFRYSILDNHCNPQTLWLSNEKKPEFLLRRF